MVWTSSKRIPGQERAKAFSSAAEGLSKREELRQRAGQSRGRRSGGPKHGPQVLLDKIWSMPFFYPLPTNLPGMSAADKEKIQLLRRPRGLKASSQP